MGVFKELDPELHLKAIEGYRDELTPEANKMEAFYQANRKCKRCGDMLRKEVDARTAWTGEGMLAKALLRCDTCGFLLEPFSGVILDAGSPAKIQTPIVPAYKVDH